MSREDDFRLIGLQNCYGTGTRSYNRSAQKREMDKQRARITAEYIHNEIIVGPICNCRSFRLPHFIDAHKQLSSEHNWRLPR